MKQQERRAVSGKRTAAVIRVRLIPGVKKDSSPKRSSDAPSQVNKSNCHHAVLNRRSHEAHPGVSKCRNKEIKKQKEEKRNSKGTLLRRYKENEPPVCASSRTLCLRFKDTSKRYGHDKSQENKKHRNNIKNVDVDPMLGNVAIKVLKKLNVPHNRFD